MVNDNFKNKRIAASQSFGEDEVKVMNEIFMKTLIGGDVKQLFRSHAAGSVMRKFQSMRVRIEKVKEERVNGKPMGTD